ncbi:1659_t:CDS:2 [Paraglomus occultum]|uniref:1659_t:CDS:1 n=1 Tax=Paraglomus occultum TaxID=144539 RepID=A0A9N9A0L0_9GLOM|nr:1659_t:CDS:2 [Paraglomus occultum]
MSSNIIRRSMIHVLDLSMQRSSSRKLGIRSSRLRIREVLLPHRISEENGGALDFKSSIRRNLVRSPYDEDGYNKVIRACALVRDLEILEHGDKTEVGEKGLQCLVDKPMYCSVPEQFIRGRKIMIMDDCLFAMNDAQLAKCGTSDEMLAPDILNDAGFEDEEGTFAETNVIKKPISPSSSEPSKPAKKAEGMVE